MTEKGDLDPDMQHIKDTVKGKKEEEEENKEEIREEDYYEKSEDDEYYDEPEEVEISEENGEPLEEIDKEEPEFEEESEYEEEIVEKELPKPPGRRTEGEPEDEKEDSSETDEMLVPETKKIDVPDIEKGPLFIKVKKFKKAKNTLQDMHDINDKLRTKMRGLESTLDEDKMNSQEVQDFLKDLEGSMGSIKEKVDPEYR